MTKPYIRLGVFATHPIQYQVALWRELARTPGLDVVVHYFSDASVRGEVDPGFGVPVVWDVPLLEGYDSVFLRRNADLSKPWSMRLPRRLFEQSRFDWVLINAYSRAFEAQIAAIARRRGFRVAIRAEFTDIPSVRSRLVGLLQEMYLTWFYPRMDAFCVIGTQARRHLERHRVPHEKMWSSPYAVDTDFFEKQRERYDREECRGRLGLPRDAFALLYSGKLIPKKAPLLLAQAIGRLGPSEQPWLLVVGEGPLRPALEAALRPALGGRLVMAGFVNQTELGRYFSAADALVLPSETEETWGLVVNEAMQFGLPVIVSDHVGCQIDLVEPEKTGLVFSSGDAESLAACVSRLMGDPDNARAMGEAGRRRISTFTTAEAARGILAAIGVVPATLSSPTALAVG